MGNALSEKLYNYCRRGEVDNIKRLLDRQNVDVNWKHPGKNYRSPLIAASKNGHTEVVTILLSKKASTGQRDLFGWNALDYASYKGHYAVVDVLTNDPESLWLNNGRTSVYNETSLHIATRCKNVEIVELLLKRGGQALINAKTSGRKTALHYAISKRNIQLVDLLLKYNASIHIRNTDQQTPLSLARFKNFNDAIQLMNMGNRSNVTAPSSTHRVEDEDEDPETDGTYPRPGTESIYSASTVIQCPVKCIVSGPPSSGKTVFTKRIKGEIMNIAKTNGSPQLRRMLTRKQSFIVPYERINSIISIGSDSSSDDGDGRPHSPPPDPNTSLSLKSPNQPPYIEEPFESPEQLSYDPRSLHIYNVGSQPELIDALPLFLCSGPALHFVFFDASCELTREVIVRDGKGYEMRYSVIQYLHQTLSSFYEMSKSDACRAILIATHIDQVAPENLQRFLKEKDRELRKYFGQAEFLVDQFLATDPKNGYTFITVDNMNGNDAELKEVVKFIEQVISKSFKPLEMPFNWTQFQHKMQEKYSRPESACCHYKEAIEMARDCHIDKDELPQVLEFLHQDVGSLLYFEEVPGLNSLVICNLDAFFLTLNSVVRDICSNYEIRKSGEIPVPFLCKSRSQESSLPLSRQHIINLLTHFDVFLEMLPIGSSYFLSSLMFPDTSIMLATKEDVKGQCPLLIQFDGSYVPIGVFSNLIVELSQKWILDKHARYSNRVSFNDNTILLLSRLSHLEIYIKKESSLHLQVLDFIVTNLSKITSKNQSDFKIGFYCPKLQPTPHFSPLKRSSTSLVCSTLDQCPLYNKRFQLQTHHKIWFQPEKTVLSPISTSLKSMPNVKPKSVMKKFKEKVPEIIDIIPQIIIEDIRSRCVDYFKTTILNPLKNLLTSNKLALLHLLIFTTLICLSYQGKNDTKVPLAGVEILASNKLIVTGGRHSSLHWEDFGLKLDIPQDALPHGTLAEIVIHVSKSGPYVLPGSHHWKLSSAVYWISSSKDFVRPVLLGIWHNVNDLSNTSNIRFVSAKQVREDNTYVFRELAGGYFSKDDTYGYISLLHFSGFGTQATRDSTSKLVGNLLQKSSQSGHKFEYSFIIYEERPQGMSQQLLGKSGYTDWYVSPPVIVEFQSESIQLVIDSNNYTDQWRVMAAFPPAICYKRDVTDGIVISNIQFFASWSSKSKPIPLPVTLSLQGAKRPEALTFIPEEPGKAPIIEVISMSSLHVLLHLREVNEILQLCTFMNLPFYDCEKIQKEYNDIGEQKVVLIQKWYEGGHRTWEQFIRVLALIKKCRKAKELANQFAVEFPETDDAVLSCPTLRSFSV